MRIHRLLEAIESHNMCRASVFTQMHASTMLYMCVCVCKCVCVCIHTYIHMYMHI